MALSLEKLFDPNTADDHPALERLFEKSKRDFWNDTEVHDWDRPIELPPEQHRPLAKILSVVYYGERCALEVASQLIGMVEDEQAKLALSAQVMEEAKHVVVFRRLLDRLDEVHPVNRWSRWLLMDLVRTKSVAAKLVGMQLMVENFANHLFHHLRRSVPDPHLKKLLHYIEKDEAKHTGLAALYLPTVLRELKAHEVAILKARQLCWGGLLARVVVEHQEEAQILGIDLHQAMIKGLETQNRIVERMDTTRGIFKSEWLERMTIARFRRLQERADRRRH